MYAKIKSAATHFVPVVAVALIVANFLTRWVLRQIAPDEQSGVVAGAVTFGVIGALAIAVALGRIRDRTIGEVAGAMFFSILASAIVIASFGPMVSGGALEGLWLTVGRALLNAVVMYFGMGLGLMLGVTMGIDTKSKALRGYVRSVRRK